MPFWGGTGCLLIGTVRPRARGCQTSAQNASLGSRIRSWKWGRSSPLGCPNKSRRLDSRSIRTSRLFPNLERTPKEHQDFETCSPNLGSETHGGQNRKEYMLSISMAKELAMVQRWTCGGGYSGGTFWFAFWFSWRGWVGHSEWQGVKWLHPLVCAGCSMWCRRCRINYAMRRI